MEEARSCITDRDISSTKTLVAWLDSIIINDEPSSTHIGGRNDRHRVGPLPVPHHMKCYTAPIWIDVVCRSAGAYSSGCQNWFVQPADWPSSTDVPFLSGVSAQVGVGPAALMTRPAWSIIQF